MASRHLEFGPFRLDGRSGQLWRDGSEIKLTPRAAAVLLILAERAPQLVTKKELFERVWGGRAVGDDALTSCVQELRGALGDEARRPRFIATRHRRGYCLMAAAIPASDSSDAAPPPMAVPEPSRLVGRAAELEELARRFDQARSGRRQMVFVTGEPGIGKSSLADVFLDQVRNIRTAKIAHGQCLDHHGVGEPYLPLIEALTRLAADQDGTPVKDILSAQAPSWLAQMPALWTRAERSVLEARGRPTRERMLRELTGAVEAIAATAPLLLKLEDIHWSDSSTLDWLAHVARRSDPARLMVMATFRPAAAAANKTDLGALLAELALHGRCKEIALSPLSLQAIESYVQARLGDDGITQSGKIAPLLLERTGGNPLFMTSIVNQLVQGDASARTTGDIVSVPQDVRRFIDRQIDELDGSDRELLTDASVIRREFATAAVAAALESDIEKVEAACARLARQGVFIVKTGSSTWPDSTRTELYSFRHDLYRELLYDRLPATRRARSHVRVGRRLEAAWAGRLDVIGSELAEHFDRGHEPARAIPHHQRAAAKAMRRSANEDAIGHLRQALGGLDHIADELERTRVELELRIGLGAAFMTMRGFGASEVAEAYSTIDQLCERLGEREDIFPALWGQWMFRAGRGEVRDAWRICEKLLALAEKSGDARFKVQAHHAAWATKFWSGKLAETRAHVQAGVALYDTKRHQAMASSYGNHDASACGRAFAAMALALAGEGAEARATADGAIAFATSLNDPFSLAQTFHFTAVTAQVLGDVAIAAQRAEAGRRLAAEYDLAMAEAWCSGVIGWCAAENGEAGRGVALLTEAVGTLEALQSRIFLCYLMGLLAEAHLKAGHHAEAMQAAKTGLALADANGDYSYSAELHRLYGEALAGQPDADKRKAQAEFRAAITLAEAQGANALQRRAEQSLRRSSR
jgi:DNA-binding winged helix-turn-helix (wHTH) protein/predicted ATPase